MNARCFYGPFVKGLLQHLAPRLTPEATARLRELGLDAADPHDVYPARAFYAALPVLADAVAPGARPEHAEYVLGREVAEAYARSDAGRGLVPYLAHAGTRAILLDAGTLFRSSCNFLVVRTSLVEDRRVRLRFTGTGGRAHLYRGIVEGAHHQAGEPGLVAEIVEQTADAATLDVRW